MCSYRIRPVRTCPTPSRQRDHCCGSRSRCSHRHPDCAWSLPVAADSLVPFHPSTRCDCHQRWCKPPLHRRQSCDGQPLRWVSQRHYRHNRDPLHRAECRFSARPRQYPAPRPAGGADTRCRAETHGADLPSTSSDHRRTARRHANRCTYRHESTRGSMHQPGAGGGPASDPAIIDDRAAKPGACDDRKSSRAARWRHGQHPVRCRACDLSVDAHCTDMRVGHTHGEIACVSKIAGETRTVLSPTIQPAVGAQRARTI